MKEQDKLRAYLRELPREEPSGNFTFMVMDRVRKESAKPQAIYQPIISRQIWWKLFIGVLLLFVGAVIFRTYFPGNEQPGILTKPLYQLDYSLLLKPFQIISQSLVKMPFAFITALAAVTALLFIDLFYNRFVSRRG